MNSLHGTRNSSFCLPQLAIRYNWRQHRCNHCERGLVLCALQTCWSCILFEHAPDRSLTLCSTCDAQEERLLIISSHAFGTSLHRCGRSFCVQCHVFFHDYWLWSSTIRLPMPFLNGGGHCNGRLLRHLAGVGPWVNENACQPPCKLCWNVTATKIEFFTKKLSDN